MKFQIQFVVMLIGLCLAACSPNVSPKEEAVQEQVLSAQISTNKEDGAPVIVMLGDSLTAGFGLAQKDALAEQLQIKLAPEHSGISIINAGVSGDTTANGLARFEWSVSSAEPDLLILALGANDYLLGIAPAIAQANLAAILDKAKSAGLPVVLVGLAPRSDGPGTERDLAYARVFPDLAKEYDVSFYPALLADVRERPDFLQADGLHPTAEGVRIIATGLAAFVEPVLQSLNPE